MLATYVADEIFPNLILTMFFLVAKESDSKSMGMEVSSAWPLESKVNWYEASGGEGRLRCSQVRKVPGRAFFES